VPLSELVQVDRGVIDKPLFTKDLRPVSYVFGDMAGKLDSPLYGLFAIRPHLDEAALTNTGELGEYWIRQPSDAWRQYALKWDGEWQITYETFRDMGAAYGVGLILIYLLVVAVQELHDPAGDHGADSADHHRRDARPCLAWAPSSPPPP
jgi:multidrug efflux pump subunit AcrB